MFGFQPVGKGIPARSSASSNDPVAGDQDRHGIGTAGRTDSASGTFHAGCQGTVRFQCAIRNFRHGCPDLALPLRALGCQRQIKDRQAAIKISVDLAAGFAEQRVILGTIRHPPGLDNDKMITVSKDCQRTDG